MILKNEQLCFHLSSLNSLKELWFHNENLLAETAEELPLFQCSLLTGSGEREIITSYDFPVVRSNLARTNSQQQLELSYTGNAKFNGLTVIVTITLEDAAFLSFWEISLTGIPAENRLESYECPVLYLPNDLKRRGGQAELFHPGAEGVLLDEIETRDGSRFFRGGRLEYPLNGISGYYPGTCPMQFQGYFRNGTGLYFAAHDAGHLPKGIEVIRRDDRTLEMFFQVFTGAATDSFSSSFPMVLGGCNGNWQDAAEIYRMWMEENDRSLPPKLRENSSTPQWLSDSPVVLIYPVKGRGFDTGSVSGNEYFPYNNLLPVVRNYAQTLHSRIMALMMHWEGTAPWAPPYVWPPYGGETGFRQFAEALHAERNLLGVYCSGIGWTQQSSLDLTYNREAEFQEKQLAQVMCRGPRDEMFARICNGGPGEGQRIGYELCPACEFTSETVCREIRSAVAAGVDYMQYFDQNQGGSAPLCYDARHGHPAGPGKWLTDAMSMLFAKADAAGRMENEQAILGCENAAAQPYIRHLPFNDLRNHLGWCYGKPVPAYAFLFHEYINNFTGNGVCLANWFDREKSPEFLQYRMAYSFISGEVLSLVLKDHGEIHWSWVCSWDEPPPDQTRLRRLTANLNRCRREEGHDYLIYGRMERAVPVQCADWTLHLREAVPRQLSLPTVLGSRWSLGNQQALILANMSDHKQIATIDWENARHSGRLSAREGVRDSVLCGQQELEVPPLETLVIEWEKQ